MALRRRVAPAPAGGDAPAEFYDIEHPAWAHVRATWDWFDVAGLRRPGPVPSALMEAAGPLTRRRYAVEAWLLANGYQSERWPRMLDWHRVKELDLPRDWQSSTHERFALLAEKEN